MRLDKKENGNAMKDIKRLHFAVVFPTLDHSCQYDLWVGITKYAMMNNIHLTAYFCTYQTTNSEFAAHYQTCFETIKNSSSLDGVIIFAGFIAQNIGLEGFEEYVGKLPKDLPVVYVSFSSPGVSSVLVDNTGGIFGVVEHLIKCHGKRRIAFVKGPDNHEEAEERLEGYKKALLANGIEFDPDYVLPGNFSQKSGRDAVSLLMERRLPADAIAASDDDTAMGVLTELEHRGVSVPFDIAVTGFDDEKASATFVPSISTARQDFYELGLESAKTLHRKLNGETVDGITYLSPVFIPRESCGCTPEEIKPDRHAEHYAQVFESSLRLLVRRITSNLVLLFDVDSLAAELSRSLKALYIGTALVGLYRAPVKNSDADADRTVERLIGFDGEKTFNLRHNSAAPMNLSDLSTIPNFVFGRERRALFFLPLFIKDEEIGAALVSFDAQIPVDMYETLRINLSTAIKGAELISKIQALSMVDDLTGLYNRRGFFQLSGSKLNNLSRETDRIPLLLFMDMDGLKAINDTYGHNEGDVAISAFARTLRSALREEDVVGRMGGDEFAVFSSIKSASYCEQLEQRIRDKFDEYNRKKLHPYDIACSIGSVALRGATKECFDAAMLTADKVLYEEKAKKKRMGIGR